MSRETCAAPFVRNVTPWLAASVLLLAMRGHDCGAQASLPALPGHPLAATGLPPRIPWAGRSAAAPLSSSAGSRRTIVVQSPRVMRARNGELTVTPNVRVADNAAPGLWEPVGRDAWEQLAPLQGEDKALSPDSDVLPLPPISPLESLPSGVELDSSLHGAPPMQTAEPIFPQLLCQPTSLWHRGADILAGVLRTRRAAFDQIGIGRERLGVALMEIDVAQPLNNRRLRVDAAYDYEFPDRAEFFWAKTPNGKGPKPVGAALGERSVDYQDLRFLLEAGGEKFSVGTELPLRFLNPDTRRNHAGLGDMNIATKLVLVDGSSLQVTQLFRTYVKTGASSSGLGNGHISLEPGLLLRHRWTPDTYLHGEIKYWFAIAGDPVHSGQVLRYGLGVSHLFYDSDTMAIIPTLELVSWTVQNGAKTLPGTAVPWPVDGENIVNLYPGLRLVLDQGGDLGLFEFGIASGLSLTDDHWYESLLRLELRLSR